ncbi:MAG: MG2 domain-containing protein [Myxococcota bacterium]|nr:MG2 domain-containing protein [Myxococcota bacterium]
MRFVFVCLGMCTLALGCGGKSVESPLKAGAEGGATVTRSGPVEFVLDAKLEGVRMRLSNASAQNAAGDTVRFVPGEPMSDKDVTTLLGRVPDVSAKGSDKRSFALRAGSLPPPKTGRTEQLPFPPPPTEARKPQADSGPFEVLRFAPEGEVELAPYVSVTFSQPVVEISTAEAAAEKAPMVVSPKPKGKFRWLGTKTLVFEPEGRMPMATQYKVTVAKGTRSALGKPLEKELSFAFATPPLGLKQSYPTDGPHKLRPVFVLGFDQRIDAKALARFVVVKHGEKSVPMRLATEDELRADEAAFGVAQGIEPERRLALIPVDGLLPATRYRVRVLKGAPSAEGPRTPQGDQGFELYTYEKFQLTDSRCDWYDACPPSASWSISFNNEIDPEAFDPTSLRIEPAIQGETISQYGSTLRIEGTKRGRTHYQVTLPAELRDVYGQRLGHDQTVTFAVGPAEPTLMGPNKPMVTLDPSGKPALSIYTINHNEVKLTVHKVGPGDWKGYLAWQRRYNNEDKNPGPLPGKLLVSKKLKFKGLPDVITETPIDLSPYLVKGKGQLIVRVELPKPPKERWNRSEVLTWVQATNIGITALADYEELVALVTKLEDGTALSGAEVRLLGEKAKSSSDQLGLARLALSKESIAPQVLVVSHGEDVALLPNDTSYWNDYPRWRAMPQSDDLRWFTFDDRKMYKPGEQVRVKGWLRKLEQRKRGDLVSLSKLPSAVTYLLRDPRGNEIAKGKTEVSRQGGFDLTVALPDNTNLGTAWLELNVEGGIDASTTSHSHSFEVQEFRRPEFEMNASMEDPDYVLGQRATASATASYYSGGGLAGSKVHWTVTATSASYSPPGWADYVFGPYRPWWRSFGERSFTTENFESKTDGTGEHRLAIHFEAMNPPQPFAISAEARVEDVNRQTIAGRTRTVLHPSDVYAGLKFDRAFVDKGQPIDLSVIAVGIDGAPMSGTAVDVRMVRLQGRYLKGKWSEEELDPQDCRAQPKGKKPGRCKLQPAQGGLHKITAKVKDSLGRPSVTELHVWVAGEKSAPKRNVEQEEVQLIPERKDVAPGQTAKFLVVAPFFPAQGVLTVRRSGLHSIQRFKMDGPTKTLELPIAEEHVPGFTLEVDLVGSAERVDDDGKPRPELPRRVAYGSGTLSIDVPPASRTLKVVATPERAELAPSSKTTVALAVKDSAGRPVKDAEVVLVVVDEAVLALTGYLLPDPISVFYARRGDGVDEAHSREQVLLADPRAIAQALAGAMTRAQNAMMSREVMAEGEARSESPKKRSGSKAPPSPPGAMPARSMKMAMAAPAPEMDAASAGGGADGPAIALRTDLRALAAFSPKVMTDQAGKAKVPITLPDSLTRYRVMAVAASGKNQFGAGESSITAKLPLQVRPSAPRFLNFGDEIELPVVVQNQTDEELSVSVAVRATNAVFGSLDSKAEKKKDKTSRSSMGKRLTVPPRDRLEVRFPVAADMAGRARFQVVAAAGAASDAAEIDLPVWTPATTEAFASYGEIDNGAMVQPVRTPGEVWPQFGGLEVTTSSTQLAALTDAVVYLASYPYDCSEQIASRMLAIAALKDVLSAFHAEGLPSAEELRAGVRKDIKAVLARQNGDGGFAFWRAGDESWPYLTIHVGHALARAKQKGWEIPQWPWNRTMGYLRNIEEHIPHWYSQESRLAIQAYALYTLHQMGDSRPADAESLYTEGKDVLSLEALGWLLPVLAKGTEPKTKDAILRHLGNRVAETAGAAHFATSYSDGAHVLLHSDRRADGVLLEALVDVQPKSDLIPKVVRGLLAHRTAGKWSSTQENAFVLLGLDRYFNVFEKATPDFVARVWLGSGFAGEHKFKGRTTEEARIDIPMEMVHSLKGKAPLTIAKEGTGRLYYRIGMRYAPKNLKLAPADYGFSVSRTYEAVDNPEDVKREKDGTWRVKAGSRVRVRLSLVAPTRRYHVALVDPLPAGLEVINPALAVAESVPTDPQAQQSQGRYWWWLRPWYEHQNLRDERVEAFTSLLWEGVHEYTYVTRATTPGKFVIPPTKAEEMYAPETFGRAGSERMIIE